MRKGIVVFIAGMAAVLMGVIGVLGFNGREYERLEETAGLEKQTESGLHKQQEADVLEESAQEPASIVISGSKKEQEETESYQEPEDPAVHLLFAGDVLLSDHVLKAYDQAGGIGGVLGEGLRSSISQADIFMVNQEFPFSDRGTQAADKQYTFRLPMEKVSVMNELEIDIVTLANNHALDFGTDALLDTGTALDQAGIRYVGAGENLERAKKLETIEAKGKTIGFLAASRVIPVHDWNASSSKPGMLTTYDPAILLEEIKKAREVCDYVVVYVHWGIERSTEPESYQRTMGRQYIDAGADLVIGSHPHVLQGIEFYKGKPVVYSLGNFIFGSSIPKTMLLKADWDGEETKISLVPAVSSAGYTRELTDTAQIQEFYQYIESLSFDAAVGEDGVVVPSGQ